MNIQGMTSAGLLMMYGGIRDALAVDDNVLDGQAKLYRVREFADWREQATAIETELDQRQVCYQKILW